MFERLKRLLFASRGGQPRPNDEDKTSASSSSWFDSSVPSTYDDTTVTECGLSSDSDSSVDAGTCDSAFDGGGGDSGGGGASGDY